MFTYTFQTPDHGYDFVPDPLDSDIVIVKSEFKDSLEELLNTLELAGISEAPEEDQFSILQRFQDLTIEENDNEFLPYSIALSKADLALYLQFEVLNYMGAAPQ